MVDKDSDKKWNSGRWSKSLGDDDFPNSEITSKDDCDFDSPNKSRKNYKVLSDSFERESLEKKVKDNWNDVRKNTLLDMIS